MALLEERALARRTVTTPRGVGKVYSLTANVWVISVVGHLEMPVATLITEYGTDRMDRFPGKHSAIVDWLEMTGYDSPCRSHLTEWSLAKLDRSDEVHLGVVSKIVAMGVQVANIALGSKITTHATREALERELARLVARPRASVVPGPAR